MLRARKIPPTPLLLVLAIMCLTEASAAAQESGGLYRRWHPIKPESCAPLPYFSPHPSTPLPGCAPAPGAVAPTPPNPNPAVPPATTPPQDPAATTPPSFSDLASGAGVGSSAALGTPGGYLDNAIPMNNFRIRYDQGFNINRPDRAEFLYPAWREISFHPHGILNQSGLFQNKKDRGVDSLPGQVNFQEVSGYLEFAVNNRASAFVEVPLRTLTMSKLFNEQEDDGNSGGFEPNDGHEERERNFNRSGGLGDIIVGFKYANIGETQASGQNN